MIALDLLDDDHLVGAAITDGSNDIMLMTSAGKSMRFNENDVRPMGRTARGVRGVRMGDGVEVISLIIPQEGGKVLTASENGYGKKTAIDDFPVKGRGGQGVIAQQCSDRNGQLAGAVQVFDGDDVMLISDRGTLVRTGCDGISELGRNTQGVTLIRVNTDERLVSVARIEEPDEEEISEGEVSEESSDSPADLQPDAENHSDENE